MVPPMEHATGSDRATRPDSSALDSALTRVGDRWSLLVVDALLSGPHRFGQLQQALPGIATNVLAQRLRRLESERVVVARPYSERPVRYAYELTAAGRELAGALRLLSHWGAGGLDDADVQRHDACGSPVEVRWYCPTCERTVGPDETDHLHYA